ncbi:MAG: hypothetical protein GTO03_00310, partial [Planctomycetales bacterium]|nr:hypothetical protein [Planctomycetales bacterium]
GGGAAGRAQPQEGEAGWPRRWAQQTAALREALADVGPWHARIAEVVLRLR